MCPFVNKRSWSTRPIIASSQVVILWFCVLEELRWDEGGKEERLFASLTYHLLIQSITLINLTEISILSYVTILKEKPFELHSMHAT